MGLLTLSEFRERLQRSLGNRGLPSDQLDDWINDAVQDIGGSMDFEVLHCTTSTTVSEGENFIEVPDDFFGIQQVVLEGNHKVLFLPLEAFTEKDFDADKATPEVFTLEDGGIRLWPPVDEDYTLRLHYVRHPPKLTEDDDTTEFSPTWDRAVLLNAAYHAHLDLGEPQAAQNFLARFLGYVRSRIQDVEWHAETTAERGLGVATDRSDLQGFGG